MSRDWKRWPETESLVVEWTERALAGVDFAADLARRMKTETSTRFRDWIDHFVIQGDVSIETLERLGYRREISTAIGPLVVFTHDGGVFPRVVVRDDRSPNRHAEIRGVAIKVESIGDFSRVHDLGLEPVGYPLGPYREAWIEGKSVNFGVVERRGYRGFEPFSGEMAKIGRMAPHAAREALAAREIWQARRRKFEDDADGFEYTEKLLDRVIERAGSVDLACHLVFEVERDYWQSLNRAAQAQKARQDRLGLGWANHDHHTFRSSRRFFPRLIGMFKKLGFDLRERFHAGEHAGWGAQILEHPTTGIVIFADLDLAPNEAESDFTRVSLPDLPKPNTVGLWVGLHGESILEAGMHHLEAQFDFDSLKNDLALEAGVSMMPPFSDFPFLRQAFTTGERRRVDRKRADRCLAAGWISAEEHERFLAEGAIGGHLENLERNEGYKGFNQKSVGAILEATDPRLKH